MVSLACLVLGEFWLFANHFFFLIHLAASTTRQATKYAHTKQMKNSKGRKAQAHPSLPWAQVPLMQLKLM